MVDCPGHASLFRTVLGGYQIMDIMLLVVDINKGLQEQGAECLILASITSRHLIVLLNKLDLVPVEQRAQKVSKMQSLMKGALNKMKFSSCPVVAVSAILPSIGMKELKDVLLETVEGVSFVRETESPFLMAVDHCFSKKGQGTILTGTILQGKLKLNDTIDIPSTGETWKVKGMESFHVALQEAAAGDRVGISVPGLNPLLVERTIIGAPKLIHTSLTAAIISLKKIPFFKQSIHSKKEYHLSIGYNTTTAKVTLFRRHQRLEDSLVSVENGCGDAETVFDPNGEHSFVSEIQGQDLSSCFAVAEFKSPMMGIPHQLLIGSDLQSKVDCRLAFNGRLLTFTKDKNYEDTFLQGLKISQKKTKEGTVERIQGANSLIVKGFCKKESNVEHLLNLKVHIQLDKVQDSLLKGRILSRFGQTTKLRVELDEPLTSEQAAYIKGSNKTTVTIEYLTYLFRKGQRKNIYQNLD